MWILELKGSDWYREECYAENTKQAIIQILFQTKTFETNLIKNSFFKMEENKKLFSSGMAD